MNTTKEGIIKVCEYCECKEGEKQHGCTVEIRECGYLKDPWTDEEYTQELCDDCYFEGRGEEWDQCQVCDREIACTASNGMRSYFTYLFSDSEKDKESDETRMEAYGMRDSGGICTKCLQAHRMKNGLLPCEIVDGEPLHADFYNYEELRENGYELHDEGGHFCKRNEDRDNVNKTMRELVAAGNDVILDLEASGMGLEGYVGIWKRKHVAAIQSQA